MTACTQAVVAYITVGVQKMYDYTDGDAATA